MSMQGNKSSMTAVTVTGAEGTQRHNNSSAAGIDWENWRQYPVGDALWWISRLGPLLTVHATDFGLPLLNQQKHSSSSSGNNSDSNNNSSSPSSSSAWCDETFVDSLLALAGASSSSSAAPSPDSPTGKTGDAGERYADMSLSAGLVSQLLTSLLASIHPSTSAAAATTETTPTTTTSSSSDQSESSRSLPPLYNRLRDTILPLLVDFANGSHPLRHHHHQSSVDSTDELLLNVFIDFLKANTLDNFVPFTPSCSPSSSSSVTDGDDSSNKSTANANANNYSIMRHGSDKKAMEVNRMRDFIVSAFGSGGGDTTNGKEKNNSNNNQNNIPAWTQAGGPTLIDVGAGQGELCGALSLAGVPTVALERDTTQFTAIMNRIASKIAAERKKRKHAEIRKIKKQRQMEEKRLKQHQLEQERLKNAEVVDEDASATAASRRPDVAQGGGGDQEGAEKEKEEEAPLDPAEVFLCKVDVGPRTEARDVYRHIKATVTGKTVEEVVAGEEQQQQQLMETELTNANSDVANANAKADETGAKQKHQGGKSVMYDAWGREMILKGGDHGDDNNKTASGVSDEVMLGCTPGGYAMCSLHSCGSLSDHMIRVWADWCQKTKQHEKKKTTQTLRPSSLPSCEALICLGCCYGLMANPDVRLTYLGEGGRNLDNTVSISEKQKQQQQQQQQQNSTGSDGNGTAGGVVAAAGIGRDGDNVVVTQNVAAQTLRFPNLPISVTMDDKTSIGTVTCCSVSDGKKKGDDFFGHAIIGYGIDGGAVDGGKCDHCPSPDNAITKNKNEQLAEKEEHVTTTTSNNISGLGLVDGGRSCAFFINRNALMAATQAPLRWRVKKDNDGNGKKTTSKPSHDKSKRQTKKENKKRDREEDGGEEEQGSDNRVEAETKVSSASSSLSAPAGTSSSAATASTSTLSSTSTMSTDIAGAMKSFDRMAIQIFLHRLGFVTHREHMLKLPNKAPPPGSVSIPPGTFGDDGADGATAGADGDEDECAFIRRCIYAYDFIMTNNNSHNNIAHIPPLVVAKTASDVFRYFYTEPCRFTLQHHTSTHGTDGTNTTPPSSSFGYIVSRAEVAGAVWALRALLGQLVEALILVSRCAVLADKCNNNSNNGDNDDDSGDKSKRHDDDVMIALHAIFHPLESPRNVAVVAQKR